MPQTIRELLLARIEAIVRRETEADGVPDELELLSAEELLTWYDRFQELSLARAASRARSSLLSRNLRLDAAGPGPGPT